MEQTVLDELLETAGAYPNDGILPTIVIAETLKTVDEGLVSGTASRDNMHRAQTPQMFPFDAILDAHGKAELHRELSFTDDAAVFEWIGLPVRVVPGDASNFKITYPEDFPKDEVMSSLPDVRTGNGYDVHVFGPGDTVVLCGVDIPFEKSLAGHSDADVGLHALTDALLATCGAGDIGDHFPPTDPKWKGVESHVFLNHAVELVVQNGGTIMNADVTLVAEAPKISPYRLQMRERLSEILGIDLQRCSVKATTNEKMGFVGRSEGIMALATATVVYGEAK
ncbi:MAG: 2-C-methyl-D-erythritol 2,4-cyclodiphosphate synthase [Pseudomonadota bacterium]